MNNINIRQLEDKLINSSKAIKKEKTKVNKDFNQILESIKNNEDEIKFSKHASKRINSRNIKLNSEEISKLKEAFSKAENKGVKDALIIMGDKGFIANIKNKTIVTTVDKNELKDNIFTNIDGAVIL